VRTLRLEVDPTTGPITGVLHDDRQQWAFHGWLELASALQTALAEPSTPGTSPRPAPRPAPSTLERQRRRENVMDTDEKRTAAHEAAVREIYVAFGSGDEAGFLSHIADDVHWETDWEDNWAQHADGPPHFIPIEAKSGVPTFFEIMSGYTFHDLQLVDVIPGPEKVVAQVKLDYTLPSGGRYRDEQLHLWTFGPEGTVIALRHFMDTAKLLAANRGEDTTATSR
jgi:ketosteroid isomerase-like protein